MAPCYLRAVGPVNKDFSAGAGVPVGQIGVERASGARSALKGHGTRAHRTVSRLEKVQA